MGKNFKESYGIGLTVVDKILKSHKFVLDITSELSKGTSVSITIPKEFLC